METGAGLAFAEQYNGTSSMPFCVSLAIGAARQGMLHETFNLGCFGNSRVVFILARTTIMLLASSVARTSNVLDILNWQMLTYAGEQGWTYESGRSA